MDKSLIIENYKIFIGEQKAKKLRKINDYIISDVIDEHLYYHKEQDWTIDQLNSKIHLCHLKKCSKIQPDSINEFPHLLEMGLPYKNYGHCTLRDFYDISADE